MPTAIWIQGPTVCSNAACGRSLSQINPVFAIMGGSREEGYCSRQCRATKTGETVTTVQRTAPAPSLSAAAEPITPAPKGSKPVATAAAPKPPSNTPKAPRASSSPWSNLNGKLHITGKKPPNFTGNRKQIWEMIKEGMTVGALYGQCDKAGLDGKSNLAKIVGHYECAEVK